jgi:hypothetical protein
MMTERGHHRVLIRAAPLAKDFGETGNANRRSGALLVGGCLLFRRFLAAAVGIVPLGLD